MREAVGSCKSPRSVAPDVVEAYLQVLHGRVPTQGPGDPLALLLVDVFQCKLNSDERLVVPFDSSYDLLIQLAQGVPHSLMYVDCVKMEN